MPTSFADNKHAVKHSIVVSAMDSCPFVFKNFNHTSFHSKGSFASLEEGHPYLPYHRSFVTASLHAGWLSSSGCIVGRSLAAFLASCYLVAYLEEIDNNLEAFLLDIVNKPVAELRLYLYHFGDFRMIASMCVSENQDFQLLNQLVQKSQSLAFLSRSLTQN